MNLIPGEGFVKAKKAIRGEKLLKTVDDVEKAGSTLKNLAQDAVAKKDIAAFEEISKEIPEILHVPDAVVQAEFGNRLAQKSFNNEIVRKTQERGIPIYDTKIAPLYVQHIKMIHEDPTILKEIADNMRKQGFSNADIGAVVAMGEKGAIKAAAQTLAELSIESKKLTKLNAFDDLGGLVEKAGDAEGWLSRLYQKGVSLWKASIVGQLGTHSRNAVTQAGRFGLDVIQKGVDAGMQKILGLPQTVHPVDAFSGFVKSLWETKNKGGVFSKAFNPKKSDTFIDSLLKKYPKEWDRVYGTFSSDVTTGKLSKAQEVYVNSFNITNRLQEFTLRRATMQAEIATVLKNKGLKLDDVIKSGDISVLSEREISGAVQKALETTLAAKPASKLGKNFIKWSNEIPGAAFVMPFPRFLTNSLKFFFEFSPFGLMKFYRPKGAAVEFAKLLKGDTSTISRAVLGSAMMGTAFQIRDSKYAGDKWYELNVGGKTVDMRPFNPFAAYLFTADIAKRAQEGTLHSLQAKDILQGVLSANMRGGTGLYVVDEIIKAFRGEGTGQKAVDKINSVLGEITGGFFTPLNTITDIYKEFNEDARIVRDSRSEPFLGPIKKRIPGALETLPELEVSTREEPFKRINPALRQLPGLTIQERRNTAESELIKHGFTFREVNPTTGNRKADQLIAKYMGPMVEEFVIPFVESDTYKQMGNNMQAFQLKRLIQRVRGMARRRAFADDVELFTKIKKKRQPIRKRRALQRAF